MNIAQVIKNSSSILHSSDRSWIKKNYLTCFAGKPSFIIYSGDGSTFLVEGFNVQESKKDPLKLIESYLDQGYYAVGYIGYNYLEHTDLALNIRKRNSKLFPELYFNLYSESNIIGFTKEDAKYMEYVLNNNLVGAKHYSVKNIPESVFLNKINIIKNYIRQGDVYQVNLSHLIESYLHADPINMFFKYYKSQPTPLSLYIDCGKFKLIGGSMELFLKKNGHVITTRPIKGTMPRGIDADDDERLKTNLKNSPKERAENLMIVDLMRNDLSRLCKAGSVKVGKLFDVKSFKTLHQMESEVYGILNDNISFYDIIYNTFPPGSVTGAPKKRAVEIIDELEDHNRGPYCGCAGILFPDGDFTLSVSIRTSVLTRNEILYWTGSAIVYDSDPQQEYRETLLKAKAFSSTVN